MISRLKINIRGAVQGVGFRPFIYRLASGMGISGFVLNSSSGVSIEAEAAKEILDGFLLRIENEKPGLAVINSLEFSFLDPVGFQNFEIMESNGEEEKTALILPDIAVCDDCLKEMFNPDDRRHLYPFLNCTNCGPRFTIIEALPYDRPNTSMKEFEMCDVCRREYEDPMNRRFHAQPAACPACGPHIELWDKNGNKISSHNKSLQTAIERILKGEIVALKGIGGFQLIADATNDNAVRTLRERKRREEKPFALMFPDLKSIKTVCEVSAMEERLLKSSESPIVLLKKKLYSENSRYYIANTAAPGNLYFGVMLPYSPLHHLLMKGLNIPVLATSANLSEEPIVIDENEALEKLRGIADCFLVNNRKIVHHADDSIVRVILNREMVIRRARGYAPLPVTLKKYTDDYHNDLRIISAGGQLKNTVSVKVGENIFSSQHIGDLSTKEAADTFEKTINDFRKIYNISNDLIVTDLHPDYISTKYAKDNFHTTIPVQHHEAHIAACIAENQIEGDVLGVSWDGSGYGYDGTIWGSEFFIFSREGINHVAQFRKFHLPGGDAAAREPRRSALGLLHELYGENIFEMKFDFLKGFSSAELNILKKMLSNKINTQSTSSAGRLFDAVAALLNINYKNNYEGQAPMMLEFSAVEGIKESYHFAILNKDITIIDWQPAIEELLLDLKNGIRTNIISAKFHVTMAEIICSIAGIFNKEKVALSGGVFQNAYLLECTVSNLKAKGFKPYWHQRVPTNDGGISVGQIYHALKYSHNTKDTKELINVSINSR